jgi:hypothetical protein
MSIDTGHENPAATTMPSVKTHGSGGPEKRSDNIASFMSRVVPWPNNELAGYVNFHWKYRAGGMPGLPTTTLDAFMELAQTRSDDAYFCLSLQKDLKVKDNKTIVAERRSHAAVAFRAIWLDLDVKPKAYASIPDALQALTAFCNTYSLPPPTALVASGNGLHVYWITDKVLSPDEWRPYAEGLKSLAKDFGFKCDLGCTIDAARVLRIPGTFNCKQEPKRAVKLLHLAPHDLDFATLQKVKMAAGVSVTATASHALTQPLCYDPAIFQKKPIPPGGIELLSAGIGFEEKPLDPRPVLKGCPMFSHALMTGGAGQQQGEWMNMALACTFMEGGEKLFHLLSKGYRTYSLEEANAMWQRSAAKKAGGMRWPSCATFENNGCTQCAGCKHRGKAKSPLNLALQTTRSDQNSSARRSINPVEALMSLRDHGAGLKTLLAKMNETYAVVRYGGKIVVAGIIDNDITFMAEEDFHRMFANLVIFEQKRIRVSRHWFDWDGRRQYLGRGVVFEPGAPLEIPGDMLNLWRGFGLVLPGDWSLMKAHILNVVCSANQGLYDYLIRWMAYAVQHPSEPMGVAVALLGAQGAGKGIVARTFGEFFGKHFAHITHSDQLTGRFNASLGTSCAVFLDEALWGGDKKGEGVLKSLITEPTFQLEAKFRDPIMVPNRLRIMVASNNEWAIPTGIGDRRWFVLNVASTYAGTAHRGHWTAIYAEIKNGGAAAMLHDLLKMDLSGFDVRAIPPTAAKAQQQILSLHGARSWLHHALQEGAIGSESWRNNGLTISKDQAYQCYEDFSKRQREYRPEPKGLWSKSIRAVLGQCLRETRPGKERVRSFQFAPLVDCRRRFEASVGAPNIEWEPEEAEHELLVPSSQTAEDVSWPAKSDVLLRIQTNEGKELEFEQERVSLEEYEPEGAVESD